MQCFNHHDRGSVGLCKHCSKALCPDCLTDLGHGLACRDLHEPAVERIHALISRNTQVNQLAPRTWYVVPAFTAFMGLVFAGYGFFGRGANGFTAILGLGFIAYSVVLAVANHRAFKSKAASM